jgi:hypothetical protein
MPIKSRFLASAALALVTLFGTSVAEASVIYQSIPDLTVTPEEHGWCSQCTGTGDGQDIGQFFTLDSGAVANTLTFAVQSGYEWPTSVTIDLFRDAGGSALGANIFHQTFSSFVSDTATGHGTDLVTVNLGNVPLAAGSYDLFMVNTGNLGIPGYAGGAGDQIYEELGPGGGDPSVGDHYGFIGTDFGNLAEAVDSGIVLAGVPEPASWAMMLVGVFGLGMVLRSNRRRATALAA